MSLDETTMHPPAGLDETWRRPVQTPKSVVLLVAVHPMIEELVCHMLALNGYASIKAASEAEALEQIACAQAQGHCPTMVLLDSPSAHMIRLDAASFLNRLRANWRSPLPLPALIRFQDEREKGQRVQWYIHYVLPKPFHLWRFLAVVRACEELVAVAAHG